MELQLCDWNVGVGRDLVAKAALLAVRTRLNHEPPADGFSRAIPYHLASYGVHGTSVVVGSILVGQNDKALAAAKRRDELLFTGPVHCYKRDSESYLEQQPAQTVGTILA